MNSCAPVSDYPSWMSSVPAAGVQSWLILLGVVALYIGVIALVMWRYPRIAVGARTQERRWLLATLVSFAMGVFFAVVVNPSWSAAISAWHTHQFSLADGQRCVLDQLDARYYKAQVRTLLFPAAGIFLSALSAMFFLRGFVNARTVSTPE
jgi:hypothetical protein